MRWFLTSRWIALLFIPLGICPLASAQDASPAPAAETIVAGDDSDPGPGIEMELVEASDAFRAAGDLAFAQFLSPELLGAALDRQSPQLLTDAGILLLTGERTLLRRHAALDSTLLLRMAYRQALLRGDKPSQERLQKAAQQSGRDDLLTEFRATERLTAGSRAPDAAQLAAIDDSPAARNTQERLLAFLAQVDRARSLGQRDELQSLQVLAVQLEFTEKQTVAAQQAVQAALGQVPGDADPALALLGRLADASRGGLVVETSSVLLATSVSIYSYAKANMSRKVGDGECATLAAQALRNGGFKSRQLPDRPSSGDYVWGTRIATITPSNRSTNFTQVFAAGAILQMRNVELRGANPGGGTYYRTAGHHTGVVGLWGRDSKGRYMEVYEQNVGPTGKSDAAKKIVQVNRYYLDDLVKGTIWVHKPIK
ncbi:MAG: hypothetical protein U0935_15050 [Pirellulales bacterium]